MPGAWSDLDRILRGEATRMSNLRRGRIEVRVGSLCALLAGLAMVYGACMGSFALFKSEGASGMQLLASVVKVPALFALTLAVTLPSLYVSNALVGSRLKLGSVVQLLAASLAITITVLASLGPIVAFFSVSTTSYAFMVLLNVAVFAASGALGLFFLLQTLQRLSQVDPVATENLAEDALVGDEKGETVPGPLEPLEAQVLSRHVKLVFRCWVVLFGLVGAQMSWVLRPLIGDPARPFTWFRGRESNFFEAVWNSLSSLFS